MIDAYTVRRIQSKRADELHMLLCAKIEQAIVNAVIDRRTALLVQLHSEIQTPHFASIRLEAYAYDIERLQFVLRNAGYKVYNAEYKTVFMIKW